MWNVGVDIVKSNKMNFSSENLLINLSKRCHIMKTHVNCSIEKTPVSKNMKLLFEILMALILDSVLFEGKF